MATKKKPTVKKAKPTKAAKPKKVTLLSTELDPLREADSILTDVEKAEAECERRALRVEIAKEDYTSAMVAYKDAVVELRKLCRARKEKHPLFDAKKKEAVVEQKAEQEGVTTVQIKDGADNHGIPLYTVLPVVDIKPGGLIVGYDGKQIAIADGEYLQSAETLEEITNARKPAAKDWQDLPLDAAKINGRGGKLLAEAGYETLGAVAKLMRDHGQWWNKEVKGIGEETAAEIADRFAGFWAEHPEYLNRLQSKLEDKGLIHD